VFGWLTKKKPKPTQIDDPVFGRLTWAPSLSYWEAKIRFSPVSADVFLKISAEEESGPGEAQYLIFQHMVERYAEVFTAVAPLLRRNYDAARAGDDTLPRDVPFYLEELSIPATESDSMKWEMRYFCDDGGGSTSYIVQMQGWQPTGELFVWD
jgi:hypothetical protein